MLTEDKGSELSKDHQRVKSGLAAQKEQFQEQIMSGPLPGTAQSKSKKDVKF